MNRTSYLAFLAAALSSTAAPAAGEGAGDTAGDADAGDAQPEGEATTADSDAKPAAVMPAVADKAAADKGSGTLGDVAVSRSPFSWEPFGFLRLQYIFVQNDPNVAFVGRDDGFEIQNARFGVRGAYEKRVRYQFSIDGAVDERTQPNTPQGKLRVGLRDAFADVVTSGRVFVRAGFFQTWADPQRLVADTHRELVDRPIWSRGVRSTEGYFTPALPPGRSIGAALRVEPEKPMAIGFEVAVQNGADEFASNNDNDLPAVSAAAMLRLADDGFVVAGARYNPRTGGELPFRRDENDLQGSVGLQFNTSAVRVGAGGLVQRTTYATSGPLQNAYGAHAQLMFRIPAGSPVWVGYRFGILDPSSLIVTDRVIEHTAGGSVGVPDLRMRVQLQVTHVMEQAARELSNSRIQLAAEISL